MAFANPQNKLIQSSDAMPLALRPAVVANNHPDNMSSVISSASEGLAPNHTLATPSNNANGEIMQSGLTDIPATARTTHSYTPTLAIICDDLSESSDEDIVMDYEDEGQLGIAAPERAAANHDQEDDHEDEAQEDETPAPLPRRFKRPGKSARISTRKINSLERHTFGEQFIGDHVGFNGRILKNRSLTPSFVGGIVDDMFSRRGPRITRGTSTSTRMENPWIRTPMRPDAEVLREVLEEQKLQKRREEEEWSMEQRLRVRSPFH